MTYNIEENGMASYDLQQKETEVEKASSFRLHKSGRSEIKT
jgi:hypothetical protein